MSTRTQRIAENIPETLKDQVHRAAENAGQAAAMVTNLQVAGSSHIEAWEAEQQVWEEREKQAIAASALNKSALSNYASEIVSRSYADTVVVPTHHERAA